MVTKAQLESMMRGHSKTVASEFIKGPQLLKSEYNKSKDGLHELGFKQSELKESYTKFKPAKSLGLFAGDNVRSASFFDNIEKQLAAGKVTEVSNYVDQRIKVLQDLIGAFQATSVEGQDPKSSAQILDSLMIMSKKAGKEAGTDGLHYLEAMKAAKEATADDKTQAKMMSKFDKSFAYDPSIKAKTLKNLQKRLEILNKIKEQGYDNFDKHGFAGGLKDFGAWGLLQTAGSVSTGYGLLKYGRKVAGNVKEYKDLLKLAGNNADDIKFVKGNIGYVTRAAAKVSNIAKSGRSWLSRAGSWITKGLSSLRNIPQLVRSARSLMSAARIPALVSAAGTALSGFSISGALASAGGAIATAGGAVAAAAAAVTPVGWVAIGVGAVALAVGAGYAYCAASENPNWMADTKQAIGNFAGGTAKTVGQVILPDFGKIYGSSWYEDKAQGLKTIREEVVLA